MELKKRDVKIDGGLVVKKNNTDRRSPGLLILLAIALVAVMPLSAFAQGSVFGTVQNADLSTPANGEISFVGFLDDTDEEIRIETSTGAGYDAGNWFDDFQNYLTEAPGNPYDYYFFNVANNEGFHLGKTIPNNSFQQEDIQLGVVTWPVKPIGLTSAVVSGSAVVISWVYDPGMTYHVYRRVATSTGSFFRIDDPSGSLANHGTTDSFFVDLTVDGISSYDYLIIAENGSNEFSQHSDMMTVNTAILDSPTLTAITPDNGLTIGGTPVTISGSGFDMAGVDVLVGTALLTGVTVISPYEVTGTTQADAAGLVDVSLTNTASAQASNILTGAFTYTANAEPVLAAIGAQAGTEGALLAFATSATDGDGGFPIMTSSTLPTGATYVDNGDGTANFNWTPGFLDEGVYNVTFYATDDVQPTVIDSEQVVITIAEAGNQVPVLTAIGPQGGTEQILMTFAVSASDIESIPALTTSALPGTAAFVDNGDGTGEFSWTPSFTDAGIHNVTFYATDDSAAVDSEQVVITINEAGNQAPVLATIGAQGTNEDINLNFAVSATDPDATIPILTTSTLPGTATFIDNGDGTGTFDWTPTFTDAGIYDVTFYADDGALIDSEQVVITVNESGNQAPVLATIGAQAATENVNLNFVITATDVDGTIPVLTATDLPVGAIFTDNLDGTGTFDWTPGFTDAGPHDVTFTASDGSLTDDEIVTITVAEAGNQAPVLAAIGPQGTSEDVNLNFVITASDPDGTIPILTAADLPVGAIFTDNLDGTGIFDWTPGFSDAGPHDVTFTASDGTLTDDEIVTITVAESGDQAPVITAIPDTSISEMDTLVMVITASDPEGGFITIAINTYMDHYTFVDSGNGVAVLTYIPDAFDAGDDTVRIFATEVVAPNLVTSAEFVITTLDANQPPSIKPMGPYTVEVGDSVVFIVEAFDSTNVDTTGVLYLTTLGLPTNATFVDYGNDSGLFIFHPDFGQEGLHTVTFMVVDDGVPQLNGTIDVDITVVGVNIPPVLDSLGPQALSEGEVLILNLVGTDADGGVPVTFATDTLHENMTLVDNGDGTAVFTFSPSFLQAGLFAVTFIADDGLDVAEEIVLIQVYEAGNQAPVFDSIPVGLTVIEGDTLIDIITGHDPELEAITFAVVTGTDPANFVFFDSLNGVGSFMFTPDYQQAGTYQIDFEISDGDQADTASLILEVIEAGNQPPVLDSIGPQDTDEAAALEFTITGSDPDGDFPVFTANPLPGTAAVIDNGDGTALFSWTPTYDDAGVYEVMFYAADFIDPAVIDSELVTITINDINRTPWYFMSPFQEDTLSENTVLTYDISAWDDDGTIPNFVITLDGEDTLATNMTFESVVNGSNRDGTLTFSPDYTQGDDNPTFYYVRFAVVDELDASISASEVVTFRVYDKNEPPYIVFSSGSGPFTINEGETLVGYAAQSLDNDGTATLALENLPDSNFTVNQTSADAIIFGFMPDYAQSGQYLLRYIATDDDLAADTQIVEINVVEVGNQAPYWTQTLPATVQVFSGQLFDTTLTGVDPEGLALTLEALPSVPNATWTVVDNDGTFRFTPDPTQVGMSYLVTFTLTDQVGATDVFTTTFEVNTFMRGDLDGNTQYTINDVIYLAGYMFRSGASPNPMASADADGSGQVDVGDIAYLINYLYHQGPRPPQ